ncbi:MAG: protein kinase family protein [Ardenticatenaceae bacterium]|nr:protein kinase family protein [Anaerolineales bacterium]MCB9005792.1 protein kinase family protein [Ardenticatenaceae bacterium]
MINEVEQTKTLNKFWISRKYYMLVDENGHTLPGETFEGALGYVIRLYSSSFAGSQSQKFAALKIPKLIGTTHRENAYVNELMAQEVYAVDLAYYGSGQGDGLLDAFDINIMRRPIDTTGGPVEARSFDGGIAFVYFEAGQPPRFLLFGPTGIVYPQDTQDFPIAENYEAFWDEIRERSAVVAHGREAERQEWANSLFFRATQNNKKRVAYELIDQNQAAESNPARGTWYGCLPSVIYRWADGTLQEAVSLNKKQGWRAEQHLALVGNLCEGLVSLHSKGLIHADIRPANIFFVDDPQKPGNYALGDYGSLALTPKDAPRFRQYTSHTRLDRVMEGERTSIFYSPERFKGQERETANKAYIIHSDPKNLYLVLGWKGDEGMEYDQVSQKIEEFQKRKNLSEEAEQGVTEDLYSRLKAGDRVRIQDYIFELSEAEENIGSVQVLKCLPSLSKMVQSRIAVMEDDIDYPDELAVDRVIEMQQWSAATDLYSLGVLLLYSIFRNTDHNPEREYDKSNTSIQNDPDATLTTLNVDEDVNKKELATPEENQKEVEDNFREMLVNLASPSYFRSIWPDLESLRLDIENNLNTKPNETPVTFARLSFPADGEKAYGRKWKENVEIRQRAIEVTRRITQTAPGTRRLVAALDFDLAAFVFILHFALACLHRKNHLRSKWQSWMDKGMPFCQDRTEKPTDGAATRALERLVRLDRILADNRLAKFRIAEDVDVNRVIPHYNPDPETTVLSENYELREERKELESENHELREEGKMLEQVNNQLLPVHKASHTLIEKLSEMTGSSLLLSTEVKEAKKALESALAGTNSSMPEPSK